MSDEVKTVEIDIGAGAKIRMTVNGELWRRIQSEVSRPLYDIIRDEDIKSIVVIPQVVRADGITGKRF